MEEAHVHALDYLSVFRRRKWWLIAPIVASIAIGAALVRYLPKQYKASATLAVIAPGVSPNFVNQNTAYDNQERIRAVTQQLLSASVLTRVARAEGLTNGTPDDALLAKMRSAVAVGVPDPLAPTTEPRRLDAFIVSYTNEDPWRAQRVANRLAHVFVDENSKTREQLAEHTSAFITTELDGSQKRLAVLEERLRKAKESYMGRLPEQTQANLQTLSGLRTQMNGTSTALASEQDRLSMIERQIDGLKRGLSDVILPPRPGASASEMATTPQARVTALQRELASARLTYTDKHPEVVRLQDELATARKDAAADLERPESDRTQLLQGDPTYRQLLADREIARMRVRELQRSDEDIRRQITAYQARVEAAPSVEQQLVSMQRDYELEKKQYGDLSDKLHAATIAENIERNRRGEQFTVLYSAPYPTDPVKPVPLRVMLLSIVAGICVGAVLTLGREYLDRSVHDLRELREELDLPVLGEIGRIQTV
jgi:succinoglycan biosynthesis transport protein ExoP